MHVYLYVTICICIYVYVYAHVTNDGMISNLDIYYLNSVESCKNFTLNTTCLPLEREGF